jgi:hypothetical protein
MIARLLEAETPSGSVTLRISTPRTLLFATSIQQSRQGRRDPVCPYLLLHANNRYYLCDLFLSRLFSLPPELAVVAEATRASSQGNEVIEIVRSVIGLSYANAARLVEVGSYELDRLCGASQRGIF